VFNGPDEQFVGGRLIGADAGIGGTYAVMPEVYVKMNEALAAGDFDRARLLQNAANEVTYTMCSAKGNMYAVAKAVLKMRTGIDFGSVRAPLLGLDEGDSEIVQKAYELVNKAVAL
jgi:N-acetylneuraminate lyase